MAEKNLKIFAETDVDVIVTDCSSCASFLKEYKKVYKDDQQKLELVEKTRPKIRDVVEFLHASEFGESGDKAKEVVDSYHDSHAVGTDAVQKVVSKDGKAIVNKSGLVLITGGIFGLGETQEDRISMLESLASLNPTSVPINFYHHNEALELQPNSLTVDEALNLVKLTRETLPNADRIMVAGGRELMFGDRQNEIFKYGANSIVVGNYLTTSGRVASKDLDMLESLNLSVAKKVK